MISRRLIAIAAALLTTSVSAAAIAAPGDDTATITTAAEETNPSNRAVNAATDLYPNDDLFVADNSEPPPNQVLEFCAMGNPATCGIPGTTTSGQDANSTCPGSICNFPFQIESCTFGTAFGLTDAGTCTVSSTSSNLTVNATAAAAEDPGPLFITYTTASGTAEVTGYLVTAVAEGAEVSATDVNDCTNVLQDGTADFCVDEDETITFDIDLTLNDQTGSPETITELEVDNVPVGSTLSAPAAGLSVNCVSTTCTVTGTFPVTGSPGSYASTVTLMYTPPEDFATVTTGNSTLEFDVTATTEQTDGTNTPSASGTTQSFRFEVQEIADLPIVNVPTPAVISGVEDTSVQISGTGSTFTSALQDLDGSEQLTLLISGVPSNATLSPGIDQGGGVWSVSPAQLASGVFFSFTDLHLDTNVVLTLTATASENYSFAVAPNNPLDESQAVVARNITLEMNAEADTPSLTVGTTSHVTPEDTSVQLDFSGMLVDMDGSENLTFMLTNLPDDDDLLSAGTYMGSGEWMVSAAQLPISFVPELHNDYTNSEIQIDVRAVATEGVGTCSGSPFLECNPQNVNACNGGLEGSCDADQAMSGVTSIDIEITAVADAPTLSNPGNFTSVNEGANVNLDTLIAARVDDDGSESCDVVITWDQTQFVEPEMVGNVTFNRGGSPTVTGETWAMTCAQTGGGLDLQLPSNGHGTVEFCVTATTMETRDGSPMASTGPECFTVQINPTNQVCDDGYQDVSEECDDGSANANSPNACRPGSCTLPTCGDGIFDDAAPFGPTGNGEECDAGGGNSDVQPDTCRTDCRLPFCGDNVEDMFEACDDGNNGIQTDACLDGCLAASCGDGFTWAGNEECDNGLMNSDSVPDACRTTCVAAGCTDGVLDTGEVCDDGNTDDGDACPSSCQDAFCGDGFTFIGMEECDQGANNSDIQPDTCRTTCDLPFCGDEVVDTGEECDDANTVNEDICVNTCEFNFCGDGFVDLTNEECDEGDDNSNSDPDTCRPDCSNPFCGDGVVDSGESCDLGINNDDNDPNGCKTNCALPGCGDGVVGPGEQCDDGANNSNTEPDACRITCTLARCGDGVLDTGETCDDGPANSNQVPNACRTTCLPSGCGDGVVDAGETCDDGANNSDTTPGACRTACVVASCGDGVTDPGEMCDDGPNNSDTASGACRTTCVLANCGDGVLDPGEACDDGAANGTDPMGCETDCTLPPECGDGFVDEGEECDDGALNSDDDADACRTDCTSPICGDGVIDSGEECDAGSDASDTCDSECVIIEDGGDMGMGGDDMGNNANNITPDMGANNANNGMGDDMGGGVDMADDDDDDNPNTTPEADDGCCRTIRRSESDSGVAGWLAMLALGLIALRRRR